MGGGTLYQEGSKGSLDLGLVLHCTDVQSSIQVGRSTLIAGRLVGGPWTLV